MEGQNVAINRVARRDASTFHVERPRSSDLRDRQAVLVHHGNPAVVGRDDQLASANRDFVLERRRVGLVFNRLEQSEPSVLVAEQEVLVTGEWVIRIRRSTGGVDLPDLDRLPAVIRRDDDPLV